jgi:hypothetical protein
LNPVIIALKVTRPLFAVNNSLFERFFLQEEKRFAVLTSYGNFVGVGTFSSMLVSNLTDK